MAYGIMVSGVYIGTEIKEGTDSNGKSYRKQIVGVAVGVDAYKIYMKEVDPAVGALKMGEEVTLRVRPYAARQGVGFSDGELMFE